MRAIGITFDYSSLEPTLIQLLIIQYAVQKQIIVNIQGLFFFLYENQKKNAKGFKILIRTFQYLISEAP